MPQVQLAIAVASMVITFVGFLLRNAIEGFNKRLDRLEDKFGDFISHISAQNVDLKNAKEDIEELKIDISSVKKDMDKMSAIQETCRSCNNR